MKSPLEVLQPLGRALMLPIAVLPVAALLLRIGQPDLLGAGLGVMTGGLTVTIASVVAAAGGRDLLEPGPDLRHRRRRRPGAREQRRGGPGRGRLPI
jgi:hypothetical protein